MTMANRQPPRVPSRQDPLSPHQEFSGNRPELTIGRYDFPQPPPAAGRLTDPRVFGDLPTTANLSNFSDPGPAVMPPNVRVTPTQPHTAIYLVEKGRYRAEHEPTSQDDLQGWEYDFHPRPDSKYECPICLLVLRDPMQTMCGHRFCSECIHKWLRTPPDVRCPACNEIISDAAVFPDKFANREILNFTIKCPKHAMGCAMVFPLKELDDHLSSVCDYEKVQCPNQCGKPVLRKDVEYHCDKECSNRMVLCHHCRQRVPATEETAHCKVCPEMATHCEHCLKPFLRKEIESHRRDECEEAPVTCSFYAVGCVTKLQRKSLQKHNESNMQTHLDMLMQKMNQFLATIHLETPATGTATAGARPYSSQFSRQDESSRYPAAVAKQPYSSNKQAVPGSWEELGSSVTCQRMVQAGDPPVGPSYADGFSDADSLKPSFFDDLDEKRKHQDGQLVKHEQQLLALSAKVDSLEKKLRDQTSVISQKDDVISALESRLCNGVFYWRIKEFSTQRQEAKAGLVTVLHSSGFYTSCHGYKLCIRANLNGVDGGNGSHISLFIHFMRGDFDDILDWPFKGRITLTILDQGEHKQHIVEILESKPNLAAFQRPHSNRNHKGFGYIEFAPIGLIENSSYVKNDTLIIKAEVTEL